MKQDSIRCVSLIWWTVAHFDSAELRTWISPSGTSNNWPKSLSQLQFALVGQVLKRVRWRYDIYLIINIHRNTCVSRGASPSLNCLIVSSLRVVRILEFLRRRCNVNLQFNKQAGNMKSRSNHIKKTMHILPFALKGCAHNIRLWY